MTTNPLTAPISPATIATERPRIHDALYVETVITELTADYWQAAASTWAEYTWPAWVPQKVREQVESFWSESLGRGPAAWKRSAETNGAPEMGSVVTLRDGFGSNARPATGRFVFAWNNIGRLVMDDGSFVYTSFHASDFDPGCRVCGAVGTAPCRDGGRFVRRHGGRGAA